MLARFEMRVREAEEDAGQLGAPEEVGQELHRVGAQGGDVLVFRGRVGLGLGLAAQGADPVLDVRGDLRTDLETWKDWCFREHSWEIYGMSEMGRREGRGVTISNPV